MGKRKGRKVKVRRAPVQKLDKEFECPFCANARSVGVSMDRKTKVARLSCRMCGVSFQAAINAHTPEPVDVYALWIDSCEDVNNGTTTADTYGQQNFGYSDYRNQSSVNQQFGNSTVNENQKKRNAPIVPTAKRKMNQKNDDDDFLNEDVSNDEFEEDGDEEIINKLTRKEDENDFGDEEDDDDDFHEDNDDDNNYETNNNNNNNNKLNLNAEDPGRLKKTAIRWDDEDDEE